MKRLLTAAIIIVGVAVVIATALLIDARSRPAPSTPIVQPELEQPAPVERDTARAVLDTLEVKGRAPMTDYQREQFGQAWSDDVRVAGGRNGCDTRNDVLRRDLDDTVIRPGTHGCLVESGTLVDPYSGKILDFVRGERSGEVQIDHVVALADAWQKGAQAWDADTRRDFANDPANLLAVDGALNQQKGAGDAATWLPPDTSARCDYARRIIGVKATWGLWVTEAEKEALGRELTRCE